MTAPTTPTPAGRPLAARIDALDQKLAELEQQIDAAERTGVRIGDLDERALPETR